MTIELTAKEWADLHEWLPVRDDLSYAKRIAELIAKAVAQGEGDTR